MGFLGVGGLGHFYAGRIAAVNSLIVQGDPLVGGVGNMIQWVEEVHDQTHHIMEEIDYRDRQGG